jgi:hypothetical protein
MRFCRGLTQLLAQVGDLDFQLTNLIPEAGVLVPKRNVLVDGKGHQDGENPSSDPGIKKYPLPQSEGFDRVEGAVDDQKPRIGFQGHWVLGFQGKFHRMAGN